MSKLMKVGVVLGGYAVAFAIASGLVYLRQLATSPADLAGSPGMYAFGDMTLFLAVFTLVAMLPTGFALYYLRPFEKLWLVLSGFALAIAITAPVGAILSAMTMHLMGPREPWSPLAFAGEIGFIRTMAAPLPFMVFLTFAIFAPSRRTRWSMLAATGLEGVACLYFLGHLLLIRAMY
jgi:hypothetical protein